MEGRGRECLFLSRRSAVSSGRGVTRGAASRVVIGRAVIVRVVVRPVAVGIWKGSEVRFFGNKDTKMHSLWQLTMIGRTGVGVGSTGRVVVVALAVVAGARRVVTRSAGHVDEKKLAKDEDVLSLRVLSL